ncbi:MAG: WecB/TagA/CpsF family glycosyltransferase [Cyanobacteria bacterium J06627_28]
MESSRSQEFIPVNIPSASALTDFNKRQSTQNVIGFSVCSLSLEEHLNQILKWAEARLSKVVCVANVHMLMEGHWHDDFSQILKQADMLTPDGMPLAWMVSWLRSKQQDRVAGMDLLLGLCQKVQQRQKVQQTVKFFFVGSTPDVLSRMEARLQRDFPLVEIAGIANFPFRPLTEEEDQALVKQINASGAGIVFVSLGCPKQERWMNEHRGKVRAVMIGLGGAFPVFAGKIKRAPASVRKLGLEWLYRLVQEPGRLWQRYASTIPPFVFLAMRQAFLRDDLQHEPRWRDENL